jgi:glycine oxidase
LPKSIFFILIREIRVLFMQKRDFIIVGQGLAGSILALELLKQGKSICVIDNPALSSCSKVAGGIYNPVVFKRMTRSWMAETTLPYMFAFFAEAEQLFGTKLVHQNKIARIFTNENDEDLWKKKSVNDLADVISGEILSPEKEFSFLKHNYAFVTQGGFVNVSEFLTHAKNHFEKQDSFLDETFDESEMYIDKNEIQYKDIIAKQIIFCQGHLSSRNQFFPQIKFKPAKGETLTIHCEELKTTSVLNKDIFILPLREKNHFKVGATYNWDDLTDVRTEEAKNSLLEKLKSILPYSFKIVKHEAGVRPATIDRRPVMGFHPEYKNIGIFNGFGTKSVMLAPWFAKHFCSFMENKEELLHEINCLRFF